MNVNLVDADGKFLGSFSFTDARHMASTQGQDLVLMNGKTNTYKIADAGKLKYEQKQKNKAQKAQKRLHKIKEVKMRPVIEKHDLEVKINHIRDFLSRGIKTKIIMTFRGRQTSFKDQAFAKFSEIPQILVAEGLASIECPPKFDGRDLVAILAPIQKQ